MKYRWQTRLSNLLKYSIPATWRWRLLLWSNRHGRYWLQHLQISATAKAKLGTPMEYPDGRRFRYAQNGASALAAGRLVQSDATNLTVVAATADGYLYVNDADTDTTTEG